MPASLALAENIAARDAFIVERLRVAGAVILGKTNLSEWANFRSTHSSSGWSGRGGQTHNPYAFDRSPSGSSAGPGAAATANFCTVAIGTETYLTAQAAAIKGTQNLSGIADPAVDALVEKIVEAKAVPNSPSPAARSTACCARAATGCRTGTSRPTGSPIGTYSRGPPKSPALAVVFRKHGGAIRPKPGAPDQSPSPHWERLKRSES